MVQFENHCTYLYSEYYKGLLITCLFLSFTGVYGKHDMLLNV